MNPSTWTRIRAVFERVVDLPEAARAEWLARELAEEPVVRAEVERLLQAELHAQDYLTPVGESTIGAAAPAGMFGPRPGDRLGPFAIVRLLGQGGMGAVFEARQELPVRTVALKVMRGGAVSERAHRRFRDEIAVLARLQHPGIAQVYDAGIADELPWFAMELLADALPITDYAEREQLALTARLALVQQVAAAIEHAHQRGVIHRDLKPGNILVDASGRAKVIDFGIAQGVGEIERLTANGTSAGDLLGTLLYMSPERLVDTEGVGDVRTDVYGLGVVLYQLVTGRRPFDLRGLSLAAACRRVVEDEIVPPARLSPRLPVELNWIAMRALAKDRDHRYRSVAEFGADLRRLERHEPVLAAPPSASYRLRKLFRRHRAAAAAGGAVLVMAGVTLVAIALALVRARDAEAAERQQRDDAVVSARRAEEARAFLLDVFATASPDGATAGPNVTMGQALLRAARRYEQRFGDDPLSRAELARTIGLAYAGLGEFEPAARHLQTALDLRLEHCAADTVAIARLRLDLGDVAVHRGDLAAAAAAVDAADQLLQAHPDDRLNLIVRVHRADLLLNRGDKREGEALLRSTIDELQRRYGADDESALEALDLLGGIRHRLGDLDGAEHDYRAAVEGLTRSRGADYPATLTARHNLAMVLFSRTQSREGVAMLEQVLAARRRVLGDEHEDTLTAMANLGAQLYMLNDRGRAKELWDAALELARQHLRTESPLFQFLLLNLATMERDAEHWPRAIELGQQILAVRQREFGIGNDRTLTTHTFLADVYRQAGQLDDARREYTAALTAGEQQQPPDLPNAYRCHLGLGRIALAERRFEDAETALLACRDGYDAAVAQTAVKSVLGRVEGELVRLYTAWGKPEAASRYRAVVEDASYRERAGTGK